MKFKKRYNTYKIVNFLTLEALVKIKIDWRKKHDDMHDGFNETNKLLNLH